MTARGSSLSLDVRAPNVPGDFRFYYNNDFFGSGSGMHTASSNSTDSSQRHRRVHLQHFRGSGRLARHGGLRGTNSMIFARQATVRYMVPLCENGS